MGSFPSAHGPRKGQTLFPQPLWSFWPVPTLASGMYWLSQAAVLPWGVSLPLALVGLALVASGGGHVGFHAAGGSTWHDDCLVRWLDALPR